MVDKEALKEVLKSYGKAAKTMIKGGIKAAIATSLVWRDYSGMIGRCTAEYVYRTEDASFAGPIMMYGSFAFMESIVYCTLLLNVFKLDPVITWWVLPSLLAIRGTHAFYEYKKKLKRLQEGEDKPGYTERLIDEL